MELEFVSEYVLMWFLCSLSLIFFSLRWILLLCMTGKDWRAWGTWTERFSCKFLILRSWIKIWTQFDDVSLSTLLNIWHVEVYFICNSAWKSKKIHSPFLFQGVQGQSGPPGDKGIAGELVRKHCNMSKLWIFPLCLYFSHIYTRY